MMEINSKKKTMLLVRSLNRGGAERQVVNLAVGLHQRGISVSVAVFYAGGALEEELSSNRVPIHYLRKKGRFDFIPFMKRLIALVRAEQPVILYSYVANVNLIAVLLKPFFRGMRVVWGVRSAFLSQQDIGPLAKCLYYAESVFSPWANLIVANSHAGKRDLVQRGVPEHKIAVVENGIDTEQFRPIDEIGVGMRPLLGIPENAKLLGIIGRHDAFKNHALAILALAEISRRREDVFLVCIGRSIDNRTASLKELAEREGLSGRVFWEQERSDMPFIMNQLDILVCTSNTEGFPNVVAEAMSCGTPCVVTDVGDCASLVANTGEVCPTLEASAFAEAISRMLRRIEGDRTSIRSRCRERIIRDFTIDRLVEKSCNALYLDANLQLIDTDCSASTEGSA